jgi:hypothetical protein
MSHDTYKGETPRHSGVTYDPVAKEFITIEDYDRRYPPLKYSEIGGQKFTIKDSGERQSFESGMVRDIADDKADVELIFNGPMADRWAEHLTKGAKKYPDVSLGVPNWTLARGLAELVRFRKSAVRHFRQWLRGDVDEDHAAAVFFNMNGYEYVRERMAEDEDARGNR